MDLSIEFAPTLTSTLSTSEINFLLDSVEDTTEDSVMIVEDTTEDMVDSVTIVDPTEDMIILINDSVTETTEDIVKFFDTFTIKNIVDQGSGSGIRIPHPDP